MTSESRVYDTENAERLISLIGQKGQQRQNIQRALTETENAERTLRMELVRILFGVEPGVTYVKRVSTSRRHNSPTEVFLVTGFVSIMRWRPGARGQCDDKARAPTLLGTKVLNKPIDGRVLALNVTHLHNNWEITDGPK